MKLIVVSVLSSAAVLSLKCEVCGAQFETRRGLSSHARSHLRQLGISVSESSGAPIDLLYQIAKEQSVDGQISSSLLDLHSAKNPSPTTPCKDEDLDDMDLDEKPIPLSLLAKAAKAVPPTSSSTPTPSPGASSTPPHSASPSPVVKKAPISSLLPVSSPLRSPEHKAGGMKSLTSTLSAPATSDVVISSSCAALEVDPNKDIVCQLCGAWFETRKGLSSHARAHLRHFGVEYSEAKGSPIDLLNQLIDTDDFKHKASALQLDIHTEPRGLSTNVSSSKQSLLSLSSSSTSPLLYKVTTDGGGATSKATSSPASSLLGPPAKPCIRNDQWGVILSFPFLLDEPPKEIGCEFCGEYFENRKGLSSHARSHLRQMGITEWSVNGSPIDTLREIITRRGLPCALPLKPLKTPPPSSPGPPRSPLSTSSSPPATLLSRHPFTFARPSSPPQPAGSKSSSAPPTSSSGLILKLKPEPVQLEVTTQGAGRSGGFSMEPTRDIRCEFCGEYFENRKGLSSHARSHLRQMGITEWSVNGSPIDTLREVMHKRASSPPWENTAGAGTSEGLGVSGYQASKFRKSPLSLLQSGSRLHKQGQGSVGPSAAPPAGKFFRMSPLGKRPLSEGTQSVETPHSCELCGFYFENRKALASHARAHLRQFGVTEWCVNGSPIETLSAWMRSRPQKVLEMHRSYMQGNRSTLKKVTHVSVAEKRGVLRMNAPPVSVRPARALPRPQRAKLAPTGRPPPSGPAAAVPASRFERRPLKHPSCPDGTERDPPKPPRTGTVPALVPKPPSYPLVKLVGKFYTLKCRFCEVEFHGPLSVQEDWIRHLQQHILKMNYNKPAAPKAASAEPPASTDEPDAAQAAALSPTPTCTAAPKSRSPTPPAECAPIVTATETVKVSEEQPTLAPPPLPLPTQSV
uniref:C2H2-type domain-containing protein n=1 Tax=Anabas testudineus TaxID=64144 RepID=A0AAQ6ID64_ANATE